MHNDTSTQPDARRHAALAEIAKRVLGVPTLEVRQSDTLDFHDLGVAALRRALVEAFESGALTASENAPASAACPRSTGDQVRSGGDGWDEYVTTVKLHVRALDAADAQVQVLGLIEGGVHEDGSPNAVEAYSIVYAPARRTTAENADTPGVSPDPDAWEIYDEPGAVDAASRLEAALARAASEARRLYGEPEQDLAVAAVRGYRAFLGPALRAEVDFGATDGEALHAAITRLADALAPTSEAMRAAITDALYDTVG